MPSLFQNPADQAQLTQIYAALTALTADVRAVQEQLATEAAAIRGQQGVSRAEGRTTATPLPALRQEVAAVDAQVVSYERLNSLIAARIKLEQDAAVAARETAVAAGGARAPVIPSSLSARAVMIGGTGAGTAGAAALGATGAAAAGAAAGANELAGAQSRAAGTAAELGAAEIDARDALAAAALTLQQYDTRLATTGALSSVALGGIANGTITLRQLSHQMTETIGKFGGWTLAAGAVYGVLGALNEVRQGAVDTSSTLTALERFLPKGAYNSDQARQQIVQQGQETATPLNDVGDATQQFAKVFKSQTDVFTATHVALTAAKLDNINLADSYRYLTAIVQETGMSVSNLPHLFDQISIAQDRLGARVSQLLPAFAGSVGAVQTAGGDPNALLGLESLALIRTGRTGSVIGTAFARGATNFYTSAASRGVLQANQINPDQNYTQALIEAISKAPAWNNDVRRDVSKAFFGPLRGGFLATLFRAPPGQLQHFLEETSGNAPGTQGFANKQLANATSQTNNQLTLLKVNLQAIGAELTGSKFTTPFGVLLHLLNDVLKVTVELMAAWDALPGPFKTIVSDLGAAAAIMATMRRFNLGGILAQQGGAGGVLAPIFARNPQAIAASKADAAISLFSGTVGAQAQAASARQMQATLNLANAQQRMTALENASMKGTEAYTLAEADAATAIEAQRTALKDLTFASSAGSAENLAVMRQRMIATGSTVVVAGEGDVAAGGIGVAAGAAATRGGPIAAGASEGTAGGIALAGAAATEGGPIAKVLAASKAAYVKETAAVAAMGEEATFTETALATLTGASAAAGEALTGFAVMVRGLLIPIAAGAFLGYQVAKSEAGQASSSIDDISKATTRNQVIQAWANGTSGGFLGAGNIANQLDGQNAAVLQAANNQINYLKATVGERALVLKTYEQFLGYEGAGNLKAAYHRLMTDRVFQDVGSVQVPTLAPGFGPGASLGAAAGANGALPTPFTVSYQELVKQTRTAMESQANGGRADPFANLPGTFEGAKKDLPAEFTSLGSQATVFGPSSSNLDQTITRYVDAVLRITSQKGFQYDAKAMQLLTQGQSAIESGLQAQVQQLVDMAATQTTNADQQGYYNKALQAVSAAEQKARSLFSYAEHIPGAAGKYLRQAAQTAMANYAQQHQQVVQQILTGAQSAEDLKTSQVGGVGPAADLARAQAALSGLQSRLALAKHLGADVQTQNQIEAQLNQQYLTVLQDKLNYDQQLANAQIALAQAGTANPVQQQQRAISILQGLYAQEKAAGAGQVALMTLAGQIQADQMSQVSDRISQFQAQQAESLAKQDIGQPQQAQLQNALASAQRVVSYLQSLPANQVDPTALANAFQTLYAAQGALAQYWIQEGAALIEADASLKAAGTFDPVQQAQDILQGAEKKLAYDLANNAPASQIAQDRASVKTDAKAKLTAAWQKQESTLEFLASTYKITIAQEIAGLQKLLKEMEAAHASYQQIQQVRQEIFNLQFGQGELNLNTGAMHLPSTYEVKSAILRGKEGMRRTTNAGMLAEVQTNVQMTINVHRNTDVGKVTKAIQDALGVSVNAMAQTTGIT